MIPTDIGDKGTAPFLGSLPPLAPISRPPSPPKRTAVRQGMLRPAAGGGPSMAARNPRPGGAPLFWVATISHYPENIR